MGLGSRVGTVRIYGEDEYQARGCRVWSKELVRIYGEWWAVSYAGAYMVRVWVMLGLLYIWRVECCTPYMGLGELCGLCILCWLMGLG